MKTQTIHSNALGDVLNESSATGFRITDNQGHAVELRAVDGEVLVVFDGIAHNARYYQRPTQQEPRNAPDTPATG